MYAIALDVGGTKIEGALIDKHGRIKDKVRAKTQVNRGKKQVLKNIVEVIKHLKKVSKAKIKGVGLCMPGFFDASGKVVFAGGTLKALVGVNIKNEIRKKVRLPVFLENDANCFALAEAVYGAGISNKVVIGVIWGTGIGSGIIIDKKVFSGSSGGAGEFGHILIDPSIKKGKKDTCGLRGCVEMLASGKNMARRYVLLEGKHKKIKMSEIFDSQNANAKKVSKDAIHYLGIGLATMVNILNPDIIILGGGVSNAPNKVYVQLRKEVKKYALPQLTKNLKIVRHKISDSAGTLGAAALVFES